MDEACLPDASAETDESGTAVFDALEPGLYLLSGQSVCVDRQIYTPSPLLIVCPAEREAEPELTRSPEKADYSVQMSGTMKRRRSAAGSASSVGGRERAGERKSRLAGDTGAHAARRSGNLSAETAKKIKKSLTVNLLDTVV